MGPIQLQQQGCTNKFCTNSCVEEKYVIKSLAGVDIGQYVFKSLK